MKRPLYLKMTATHRSERRALTVIELLAATMLATMMMVAILGVLQSMTRARKSLLDGRAEEPWQSRLVEQLQWDLTNSQLVEKTAEGFLLDGYAGRDFASGGAAHLRTHVRYAIAKEQSCLVRYEAHPESLNLDNESGDIACTDIDRIVIAAAAATTQPSPEAAKNPPLISVSNGPIPDRVTVALFRKGQDQPIFIHAFQLR